MERKTHLTITISAADLAFIQRDSGLDDRIMAEVKGYASSYCSHIIHFYISQLKEMREKNG